MRGFLSDCHKIETLAGEIYERLATDSAYAPEVRNVFEKLGNDERSHARDIDMVLQIPEYELKAGQKVSWDIVDAAVKLAERFVATINRGRLNEEQALRLAVEMEQQFVKVHVHNAMHFYNERIEALFEDLGKHDRAHLDRLRECLAWWHGVKQTATDRKINH